MKTSEKIEQNVENLDTAPQKAENFSSGQEQIEVENSQNFHSNLANLEQTKHRCYAS